MLEKKLEVVSFYYNFFIKYNIIQLKKNYIFGLVTESVFEVKVESSFKGFICTCNLCRL